MIIESNGFGFEIEFVAKSKKIGARLRSPNLLLWPNIRKRVKRLLKDGLDALWYLLKFNQLVTGFLKDFEIKKEPLLEPKSS